MFHRECGYYKTTYEADQAILPFPIAKQAIIGFLLFFVVWIGGLVLAIIATMAANRGEWYRYPINIRMVPGALG